MKKPSERILDLANALRTLDGKEPAVTLTDYEVVAVGKILDEWAGILRRNLDHEF